MVDSGFKVSTVVPDDLPWLARARLRSARKRGRTGVLLYGIIRQGAREISRQRPTASISEGKRLLVFQSPHNRLPKWISLPPGPHDLHFQAGNSIRSSFFDERLTLSEGDVLVAVCEPVQKRKSPDADLWSLGIIDSGGHTRPVRQDRP